jgi:hypothetical protein
MKIQFSKNEDGQLVQTVTAEPTEMRYYTADLEKQLREHTERRDMLQCGLNAANSEIDRVQALLDKANELEVEKDAVSAEAKKPLTK